MHLFGSKLKEPLFWRRLSLTLDCAPVTVAASTGLPWQRHSEWGGRPYPWKPRGLPRRSLAASRWSRGDWNGMRGEGRWRRSCPCAGVRQNRDVLLNTELKQEGHGVKLMLNRYNREHMKQHCFPAGAPLWCAAAEQMNFHYQIKSGAESSSSTEIKSESWYQPAGGTRAAGGNWEVFSSRSDTGFLVRF